MLVYTYEIKFNFCLDETEIKHPSCNKKKNNVRFNDALHQSCEYLLFILKNTKVKFVNYFLFFNNYL